jgi:hypothetical protein
MKEKPIFNYRRQICGPIGQIQTTAMLMNCERCHEDRQKLLLLLARSGHRRAGSRRTNYLEDLRFGFKSHGEASVVQW